MLQVKTKEEKRKLPGWHFGKAASFSFSDSYNDPGSGLIFMKT